MYAGMYVVAGNVATVTADGFFETLAGLPDGFFSDQKCSFGYILEDLGMEHFVIFYGHSAILKLLVNLFYRLVYFMVIWYIF
jgi:hypothetical protein